MKKLVLAAGVAALMSSVAAPAFADDYKVYSPRIEKGELAAEANLNYSTDNVHSNDHYFSQVLGFEFAPTSYWKTEVSGEVEKSQGSSTDLTNIKFENVFSPWAPGENFVDVGFYGEIEKAAHDGDPNNVEAKLLLEKQVGNFVSSANLIMSHEFGPHAASGFGSGVALQERYRYSQLVEPGIEYYADFGKVTDMNGFKQQDHRIGPTIQGKIGHVRYDTGVLFGISDTAQDTTAKLNLEYEF